MEGDYLNCRVSWLLVDLMMGGDVVWLPQYFPKEVPSCWLSITAHLIAWYC